VEENIDQTLQQQMETHYNHLNSKVDENTSQPQKPSILPKGKKPNEHKVHQRRNWNIQLWTETQRLKTTNIIPINSSNRKGHKTASYIYQYMVTKRLQQLIISNKHHKP
jgi:hypothetical protein